jgi:hypothetical protein
MVDTGQPSSCRVVEGVSQPSNWLNVGHPGFYPSATYMGLRGLPPLVSGGPSCQSAQVAPTEGTKRALPRCVSAPERCILFVKPPPRSLCESQHRLCWIFEGLVGGHARHGWKPWHRQASTSSRWGWQQVTSRAAVHRGPQSLYLIQPRFLSKEWGPPHMSQVARKENRNDCQNNQNRSACS